MLFVVLFEDNPEKASLRLQHMKTHLEFLEQNSKNILVAGPLKDANNGSPAGVFLLVEADNAARVKEL